VDQRRRADDGSPEPTRLIAVPPDARPRRILLVEDHPDSRDFVATALMGQGYFVDMAVDPEDGLRFLRGRRYDLVIAHYNMPGKTASAMLREAGAEGLLGDTPTLVVTAHPDPVGVRASELVRKPVDLTRLLLQIQRIFAVRPAVGDPDQVEGVPTPGPAPARAELVLYVGPDSTASQRAVKNFQLIAAAFDPETFRFRLCDVSQDPDSAERDQILFTPTLVKRRPEPPVWVLGDLSAADVVRGLLEICGARRRI
jgi:CheY-like chemotaxis protein